MVREGRRISFSVNHCVHLSAASAASPTPSASGSSPQHLSHYSCSVYLVSSVRSKIISVLPSSIASQVRAVKRRFMRNFIDEAEIIAQLAPDSTGNGLTLVDVGAHHGAVTSLFVDKGWSAVAYEPDPANRELFERRIGRHPRVQLSSSAVSDTGAESASLFTSSVSTGISTLSAFHDSHIPTAAVKVVTLAEDLRSRRIARVDFLKIDIEGFDFFALKGFDWNYAPRFVLRVRRPQDNSPGVLLGG